MPTHKDYVFVPVAEWEPGCQDDGKGHYYQKEHVLVAERILGRKLMHSDDPEADEIVHHIDLCKTNNDPSNLMVMTRATHSRLHALLDNPNPTLGSGVWSKSHKCCVRCGTTVVPHLAKGLCVKCYHQSRKVSRERASTDLVASTTGVRSSTANRILPGSNLGSVRGTATSRKAQQLQGDGDVQTVDTIKANGT